MMKFFEEFFFCVEKEKREKMVWIGRKKDKYEETNGIHPIHALSLSLRPHTPLTFCVFIFLIFISIFSFMYLTIALV